MSKMWEYRANKLFIEHDRQALEDVLNSVEGAGKKWKPQDELRDEFLNRMGAEGWELIDTRYVEDPPRDGFWGESGWFHQTFKREITSGITLEEREKQIEEMPHYQKHKPDKNRTP
jgi:hypothetical protein